MDTNSHKWERHEEAEGLRLFVTIWVNRWLNFGIGTGFNHE